MKPQRNRQRALNINQLANDANYKNSVKRPPNGLVPTSQATKRIHSEFNDNLTKNAANMKWVVTEKSDNSCPVRKQCRTRDFMG